MKASSEPKLGNVIGLVSHIFPGTSSNTFLTLLSSKEGTQVQGHIAQQELPILAIALTLVSPFPTPTPA